MTKFLGFFLFLSFYTAIAFAQSNPITGTVQDETEKTPLGGATVVIFLQKDSTQSEKGSTVTDARGNFQFLNLTNDSFYIEISSVGYQKIKRPVTMNGQPVNLGIIRVAKQGKELEGVTVISQASPVTQKGDTSQFSASQFKVNPDATTEDLIKKMPGITVARDGTVTAQGEQIRKVTIDGKDFFGDDASAALRNLPSEVVDKIQVFDRLSDQAQLTGFDDGNSVKALNVVTKSGIKNGQFGRAYAGYGTDDRYAAGGNVSFFKGDRRLSLVGNFNNINQQNFGSQDLLGLTSSGGRGGGGRGGGGRPGGGGGDFNVGQASGISKTNAFGVNYSDQWGKKLSIAGSYFYNNSNNLNESLVSTETFFNPKNQFALQNSTSTTDNTNHRLNLRIEYKIDSSNSIFIIPSVSIQNNNSNSLSSLQNFYGLNDSVNTSLNRSNAERVGYNIRNNILYRHSFKKRGRSFSLGFNTALNKNDSESFTEAQFRFFNSGNVRDSLQDQFYDNATNGTTFGGSIAYTEPIGKKGQIQFDYNPSVQKNNADQQTFLKDGFIYNKFDSILSNRFDNTITTNNAGISYRLGQSRDNQFSIGVNYQHSKLESERIFPTYTTVNQTFTNLLPNARWNRKLSATSSVRLFYRASTNFPSVNQLQDVVNLTNPLRVSSGNPALKQSYTHLLSTGYTYVNSKTGQSFFANVFLQTASDYISNATYIPTRDSIIQQGVILNRGSQLTKPVNLDGYKSLRTFLTYSIPVKVVKTTVNVNAGFSYAELPGLINYAATKTNNYTYNAGVVLASNVSEYIDFNLSYNANINNAKTISLKTTSNKYINQSVGIQVNLLSKTGWFVQNDVNNQTYSGLTDGFNQSYWLWNAAIGKKFLKKKEAELKLSVFDLLKQNQSIVRTITGAYIEDAQSVVLQQYFMLTFSYSLKNFGTASRGGAEGGNQFRPGMMMPGTGPMPGGPGRPGGSF